MIKKNPFPRQRGKKSSVPLQTRGRLEVSGTRMCLLDISGGWINIVLSMMLFAGEDTARRVLFEAGYAETFSGTAINRGMLDRSHDGFRDVLNIFSEAGFGDFTIQEMDFETGYARIACVDTFEAWAFLQNKRHPNAPVCYYTTGVLLSFMENVSGIRNLICVETTCMTRGSSACEFVIGSEAWLMEKGIVPPEWGMTIKEKAEYLESVLAEKKQIQRDLTRKNIELSMLNEISGVINQSLDMKELLGLAIDALSNIAGEKGVGIFLIDRNRQELVFSAQKGFSRKFYKRVSRLEMGEGIAGNVAKTRAPVAYDDYAACPHALEFAIKKEKIKSVLSVPLMSQDRMIGVLNLATKTPYHFTDGEIKLMTLVGNQLAVSIETARLQEEIKESELRILESKHLAGIGQLSANIAHEIRNPLSAIKTNIQMLSKNLKLEGFDKRRLEIATSEIRRLDRVLEDILDYAAPVRLHRVRHDIRSVLETCVDLLTDRIVTVGIHIYKKISRPLPTVEMNYEKLQQAILNLIINAIDAMPDGGTLSLTTGRSMRLGRKGIRAEISDSGHGIPKAYIARIFDPFFSTKTKGTGLGLPNVKKIIEAHGGLIQVTSRPGRGTKVRLILPV